MEKSYHLLLIEEDPGDLSKYKKIPYGSGMVQLSFTLAPSLSNALQVLESETFDAVICSLVLPDSSGPDTYTSLSAHAPLTPVIVLTIAEHEQFGLEAVSLGAQDNLLKDNCEPVLMLHTIRHAIRMKKAELSFKEQLTSEETYRKLLEKIPVGIGLTSLSGDLLIANERMKTIFGRDPITSFELSKIRAIPFTLNNEALIFILADA